MSMFGKRSTERACQTSNDKCETGEILFLHAHVKHTAFNICLTALRSSQIDISCMVLHRQALNERNSAPMHIAYLQYSSVKSPYLQEQSAKLSFYLKYFIHRAQTLRSETVYNERAPRRSLSGNLIISGTLKILFNVFPSRNQTKCQQNHYRQGRRFVVQILIGKWQI